MEWVKEIAALAMIKSEIANLDRRKVWPYSLPRVAAQPKDIENIESHLGFLLPKDYADFLLYANGWPAFYQSVDLFGFPELIGNESMRYARHMLDQIEPQVFATSRVEMGDLLPIAATQLDMDLFVLTTPISNRPGEVIWFAGSEIERFKSFGEYFLAMKGHNLRELTIMKTNG